jgi:acyl-coenzyme A synthetase/AMP-(fatty) acid ligase/D-alanine-D-alanine ligase-like ATP-grasp enzyme
LRLIEDLPERYTRLYSERRFDEWRQLFTGTAVILRRDHQGRQTVMGLDQAVHLYRQHAAKCRFIEETWSEVEIRPYGQFATLKAQYRLVSDRDVREGVDLLTLVQEQGEWKIASLAYEQTRLTVAAGERKDPAADPLPGDANLTDRLIAQARRNPQAVAVHLPAGAVTFRQLDLLVWRCAARLAAQGLAASDVLALSFDDELAALVALLATARIGATTYWMPRASALQHAQMLAASGARAWLSDGTPAPRTPVPHLHIDPEALAQSPQRVDPGLRVAAPQAPWLVISGSGSTGRPKKIPITHGQYLAQMRIYNAVLQLRPDDRVASLMSIDSVVTRERYLDALLNGASVVLGGGRQADPVRWLQDTGVTMLWAAVVQAEQLLARRGNLGRAVWPALRAFIVGSSTVSESLRRRITTDLTDRLHVYYGMNEVGLAAIAGPGDLFASPQTVGCVAPGTQLEVVDEAGCPLPTGEIGRVRFRSPGMTSGYLDDDQANQMTFRDGWFHPADFGRFTPDGRLDFCGRADHMMILNGTNIYPTEIEQVLSAHPAVHDVAAVPLRHAVHQDVPVCAVALHPGAVATEAALLDYARERLGLRGPRRVRILEAIPRNAQGKLVRAELGRVLSARLGLPAAPEPEAVMGAAVAGVGAEADAEDGANLTCDLIRHARAAPDRPALLLPDGEISYRQLDDLVWQFAGQLHDGGVRAGRIVGLTCGDELTLVLTLLAITRLGATAFSIPRNATPFQRQDLAARAGVAVLATDEPGRFDAGTPLLHVDRRAVARRAVRRLPELCDTAPAAPWLLITGSGTTGQPKLIPVTHAQARARHRIAAALLGLSAQDRVAPLSHFDFSHAKFRLHEALHVGAACALAVWNGANPVEACLRKNPSVVFATVFHAEKMLEQLPRRDAPVLGGVRVFEITSSTVTDDLRRRVRQSLCAGLYVRYGINEAGPVTVASPAEVEAVPGTLGKPAAGVLVEIVDRQRQPVPAGTVGLIRIRSPGQVDSYRDNAAATAACFQGPWFLPGDLGRFTPEGQIVYYGRADHMMIMNGINIFPAEIEAVLTAHPDVLDAAALPLRHPVHQDVPVCAVVLRPGLHTTAQALLSHARERLGAHGPHRVMVFDRIPRNHEGKLARIELQQMIQERLAGRETQDLPPAAPPPAFPEGPPAGQLRQTMRLDLLLPEKFDFSCLDQWLAGILEIETTALASCPASPGGAEPGDATRWLWRVLLLARALLQASRAPVFDLPTIQNLTPDSGSPGKWNALVTLALIDHLPLPVYRLALHSALRLCAWATVRPVSDEHLQVFFSILEKEVIPRLARHIPSGKSTLPVLQAAHQRGIPFAHLGAGVYQLGWGHRARRMDRSTTERDSAMGARLSQSKVHTARLLRMAGLAAPVHEVVGQVEEALQSARRIGWPVVVKPADLDRGEGVTVDVATEDALHAAFGTAVQLSRSKQVIVERQVPGVCHRLFIANGKLLYAVKRLPMAVQGNGRDTVSTLVDEAVQKQRRVPPWRRSEIQPLDALAHAAMAAAGYTGASVPTEGAWVPLRPIESTAWGGVDEEVTGLIHPENLRMALAAADLFGLHVAGIDIISPDIARPWHENGAVINEVNFSPLLGAAISRSDTSPCSWTTSWRRRGASLWRCSWARRRPGRRPRSGGGRCGPTVCQAASAGTTGRWAPMDRNGPCRSSVPGSARARCCCPPAWRPSCWSCRRKNSARPGCRSRACTTSCGWRSLARARTPGQRTKKPHAPRSKNSGQPDAARFTIVDHARNRPPTPDRSRPQRCGQRYAAAHPWRRHPRFSGAEPAGRSAGHHGFARHHQL